ncbi:rod shape-determining protein MreC, partial [Staphylococcus aureus]|uniref:rod shape-determining protein MreC n=1 Tax=Staphylococcus aureus TaxID=1280 RepID=UPI0011564A1B
LKDISKFDPISTTVLARNPDQWMNTTSNMAVMTSKGFVGRVTKVNKFSSQVDLISTNTRAGKLSVNIQHGSKNIFGLIDRYDEKNSELVISDINNRDNISKGDKVVTSGLADQLPSDLYIGEVTKVQNDQYGLAKEVRVKTGADLTDLSHVYVAKRDPKTIPDDESRDK